MAVGHSNFPGHSMQIRETSHRPVRIPPEHSTPAILLPFSQSGIGGSRCPSDQVATRPTLRLSSDLPYPKGDTQDPGGGSGGIAGGPALAPPALVFGPGRAVNFPTVEDSGQRGLPQSRVSVSPRTSVVAADRLALERARLKSSHLPDDVVTTMQAARRPSTTRIYQSTWRSYCQFCASRGFDPSQLSIAQVLSFLQVGLDKGLAPNTLRRQTAALATILREGPFRPLSQHPWLKDFLRGAANLRPPPIHRFPTWDLSLVLRALTGPPFEPLRTIQTRFLAFKTAFLVAITSARRISELSALSVRSEFCVFHPDRVVLRLDPAFIPKVNSIFHRALEIVVPDFCAGGTHPSELRWHKLDVRRALKIYIRRTSPYRKTDSLFVSFQPSSMGLKVSSQTIGRWIRLCIEEAYRASSRSPPDGITAHSTRSAAITAAWSTQASVEDICRAASWSTPSSFIRHYRIDSYAAAEAAFGRRVLQRVCSSPTPLAQ